VSKPLGFPSWTELVTRLAEHDQVQGKHILAQHPSGQGYWAFELTFRFDFSFEDNLDFGFDFSAE
jgi:hypothetical protein